jgi:hypothetical protein
MLRVVQLIIIDFKRVSKKVRRLHENGTKPIRSFGFRVQAPQASGWA